VNASRLVRSGQTTAIAGLVLGLAGWFGFIGTANAGRADIGLWLFLAVPLGVLLFLVGWALVIRGAPMADPWRRRGRLMRLVGTTLFATGAGLVLLAELAAFAEDMAAADAFGFPGLVCLGIGTVTVVAGVISSVVGRLHQPPVAD